jgi:hypothetical protein
LSFITFDTETVGFHGPIVLLQWAEGDGPVQLHSVWTEPIHETLDLIEYIVYHKGGVLGFNLTFDWFHMCQLYTTLKLLPRDAYPVDIIDEYAKMEPLARDGPCLRPQKALDLMLYARKGPYQNTMNRDPIMLRKVPKVLAPLLIEELEKRVKLKPIFFAKKKKQTDKHWRIKELDEYPDFVDVILEFAPTSAMKAIATDALEIPENESLVYADVEVDPQYRPVEFAYAPFALAVGKPGKWNKAWPDMIHHHITHWGYHELARKYAERDVTLPIKLWNKWGQPEFGDRDSELAIAAGASRWKGYAVNLKGIDALRRRAAKKKTQAPLHPRKIIDYVAAALAEEELICLQNENGRPSGKKQVLEEIAKQRIPDQPCSLCAGKRYKHCSNDKKSCICKGEKCERCKATGTEPTEAALRSELCLGAKKAKKQEELYEKILIAGRLHANVNIIGARSGRKSGGGNTDGKSAGRKQNKIKGQKKKGGSINPQGIQKQKLVRAQFQIAFTDGMSKVLGLPPRSNRPCECEVCKKWADGFDEEETLVGGDFDAFEVTIADAYYQDKQLREDLTAQATGRDGKPLFDSKGKPVKVKIHAIIGSLVYKPLGYWDIIDTDGTDQDLYTRAKSAFFALIYFGTAYTLATRLVIDPENGEAAFQEIMRRYPVMDKKRKIFYERYCPMKQPGGIGTKVFWEEPWDYVESMLGFKRYFTLENTICRALFELGEKPPAAWRNFKVKVIRREREQTASGAVQSAIIGATFQLQNANMRAAGNHVIQSTGAELTKILEADMWELQPRGIYRWHIRPMNCHDELMCPTMKKLAKRTQAIASGFLDKYRSLVPLLGIKWKTGITSWAGK